MKVVIQLLLLLALKKFKKKFERTGAVKSLRARKHYIKPCVERREQKKKAIYKNQLQLGKHLLLNYQLEYLIQKR